MHVSLTPQLEEIVRNKVASGMYNNASEVIREALRLLDEHDRARFEALKVAVAIGYAQAERGQYAAWTPELHAQIRQRADDLAKQDQRPKADVLP